MNFSFLFDNFALLFNSPESIAHLDEMILELAVQGKLVEQDPTDEPAIELVNRIKAEREQLIRDKKIKKPKPLPPISPDEIPYELPEGWVWVRLGEITNFQNGFSFASKDFTDVGVGVIRIGDIQDGAVSEQKMQYLSEDIARNVSSEYRVNEGDLLIAMSGATTGKLGFNLSEKTYLLNQRVGKIEPLYVNKSYIYYYLLTKIEYNLAISAGSAIPNLSTSQIIESLIPLSTLNEQKRIVAKIESLLEKSSEIQTQLEQANQEVIVLNQVGLNRLLEAKNGDEFRESSKFISDNFDLLYSDQRNIEKLKQAILQEALQGRLVPQYPTDESATELIKRIKYDKAYLISKKKIKRTKPLPPISPDEMPYELPEGWAWVRLGEIAVKLGAGSTPRGGKSVYQDHGIKFIRSQNVWNNGLRLDDVVFISEEINARMKLSVVKPKDILLNITGASIGRSALVPDDFDTGNVNQHVTIVRLVDSEIRKFAHLCLISPYVQKMIMDVQVGISREGLSMSRLATFLIPIPPLNEQKRIVAKVDKLMKLCDELESQLVQSKQESEKLMQAVLQEALTFNRSGKTG
ncbi:restriction endonuclease subunit S [bacterium]|nr:restriction endonuclease subunit S [bacterium]